MLTSGVRKRCGGGKADDRSVTLSALFVSSERLINLLQAGIPSGTNINSGCPSARTITYSLVMLPGSPRSFLLLYLFLVRLHLLGSVLTERGCTNLLAPVFRPLWTRWRDRRKLSCGDVDRERRSFQCLIVKDGHRIYRTSCL